jgi:hypothetical protein
MRFSLISAIFFALCAAQAAEAPRAPDAMTMATYFDSKKTGGMDWAHTEIFLSGIGNGFAAANAKLAMDKQKQMFCAPTMALNFENMNEIIEREYSNESVQWQPASTMRTVLLVGLMEAFPCAAVSAADVKSKVKAPDVSALTNQCIGLDSVGEQECKKIIYRYRYGGAAQPHKQTLAEKTALDGVMNSDPLAVLLLLPDGTYTIARVLLGDTLANRFFYIPCSANPCPK